jgi:dTDP-glucose pyrophosphorylase
MNIVMPMAGRGSRFAQVGITTPKPLIDIRGRPMYAWATDSMPLSLASRLIFLCLQEHLDDTPLGDDIRTRYAQFQPIIVPVDRVTEGQACTVLLAREHLAAAQPLIIFNADTYCRTSLEKTLPQLAPSVAGLLGVFRAEGDRWSFARTDDAGRVVETAEKVRISDWACTGMYHFSRTSDFLAAADAMIADNQRVRGEFYVAPIYNRFIAAGREIRLDIADEAFALGTPEDLADFEARFPHGREVRR